MVSQQLDFFLPHGSLGLGIRKNESGQIFVHSKHDTNNNNSPLAEGDVILSLNGIILADVSGNVDDVVNLFTGLASSSRLVVIRRHIDISPLTANSGDAVSPHQPSVVQEASVVQQPVTQGSTNFTYKAGVLGAITEMNDRTGSSCIAIKKHMMSKLPEDRKWQNKRFLSTLNKLVEDGDITKVKQTYKLSVQYKKRMEKKGKVKKASPLKKTKNVTASTINHVLVGGSANNTPGIATVSTGYITNNDPPKQKVPLNEMPTKQCSLCLKNKKKWSFTVGEWDKVGERECQVCTKAAAKETAEASGSSAASSVGTASTTTSNSQSSATVARVSLSPTFGQAPVNNTSFVTTFNPPGADMKFAPQGGYGFGSGASSSASSVQHSLLATNSYHQQTITVIRSSKEVKLGLTITGVNNATVIKVKEISPLSLFANTAMKAGSIVETINGVKYTNFEHGKHMLNLVEGVLTLFVSVPVLSSDITSMPRIGVEQPYYLPPLIASELQAQPTVEKELQLGAPPAEFVMGGMGGWTQENDVDN